MSKVRSFGSFAGQLWKANCGIDVVTQELFAECHLTFAARSIPQTSATTTPSPSQPCAKSTESGRRVITAGAGSEEAYRTFLALLKDGKLVLPANPEMLQQLCRLTERVTDGRFLVEGKRGAKDDLAVATVQAVAFAAESLEV